MKIVAKIVEQLIIPSTDGKNTFNIYRVLREEILDINQIPSTIAPLYDEYVMGHVNRFIMYFVLE